MNLPPNPSLEMLLARQLARHAGEPDPGVENESENAA
jgi:hypothetical protein